MSERANASVIPFKMDDESEDGEIDQASAGNPVQNPAERLYLAEAVRMAEAIVFASAEPVSEKQLAARLPDGINLTLAMTELQQIYSRRGVNLVRVGDAWAF
ncbi:SMC-Scp complex subunit ScpB, partial [Mesorhizobium sp. M8A.F.Ca.ET.023.01.1.1]